MVVFRILGTILIVLGLGILGWDLARWWQTDDFVPQVGGQVWFELSPGTLNLTQAVVQRYLTPALWDDVLQPVLLWPAFVVLMGLGIVLFVIGRIGRRRYR